MFALLVEGEDTIIEFSEEDASSVPVTEMGPNLFHIDGVPILVDCATFNDVIEVEPISENRYRFVRVVEPGGYRTDMRLINPVYAVGPKAELVLEALEARGVYWERVFGGLLFLCVPEGVELDTEFWFEAFCPQSG